MKQITIIEKGPFADLKCPLCGAVPSDDEYGDLTFCEHYVDHYSDEMDDGMSDARVGLRDASTHMVLARGEHGETEWYFAMSKGDVLGEVITAREAAMIFGLGDSTVAQDIRRGNIPARKSGGTWLIRRSDATERWGKPASMLLLAVGIATLIAQLPV